MKYAVDSHVAGFVKILEGYLGNQKATNHQHQSDALCVWSPLKKAATVSCSVMLLYSIVCCIQHAFASTPWIYIFAGKPTTLNEHS